jgi:hypothetical protein
VEVKRVEPYFCSILVESLFPLVLGGQLGYGGKTAFCILFMRGITLWVENGNTNRLGHWALAWGIG